jgi:SAM-dependent MidA family methyltransferase
MPDATASDGFEGALPPPSHALHAPTTISEALAAEATAGLALEGVGLAGRRLIPVPFDRFMHWALYHPREGYYAASGAGPAGPFGAKGDFVTASGLGPWFAGALARAFMGIARQAPDPQSLVIRELGAGNGDLAADLMLELDRQHSLPDRYEILEPSPAMQQLQRARIALLPHGLPGRFVWLDRFDASPPPIRGLMLANEVADALPVKIFEWSDCDTGVWEWGLGLTREDLGPEAAGQARASSGLEWMRWPATGPLREAVLRRKAAQQAAGLDWAAGHRGEWCPWLQGWARGLADGLAYGELLIIDYGYEQYELDHPDRSGGTLAAHRRHRRVDDWVEIIAAPGQQDITAHVNFTELASVLQGQGLDLRLQTQAAWLLDHGVLAEAQARYFTLPEARGQAPADPQALRAISGLQTLLSDAAMGQSFLVLSARRGISPD